MISFNSLFKQDFLRSDSDYPGRRYGGGQRDEAGTGRVSVPQVAPLVGNAGNTEQVLALAYEKLQVRVTDGIPATDNAVTKPSDSDFSPAAVTDRILGFVSDRLASARADGASDVELQALYRQALQGVERGMREARDVIAQQGLFSGEVKDNFYATVNQLADGLEALGEELTGAELGPERALQGGPTGNVASLQFERSRSVELEVVTRDGDTVRLLVQSGQSGYANYGPGAADGQGRSQLAAEFTEYDNLAFSVEGELDEGEMAALRDLMGQVNSVAETFFNGNVEQAFDQAMNLGMDATELASFSADLNQSQAVAVQQSSLQQSYGAVAALGGYPAFAPSVDVLPRLGDFAGSVQSAAQQAGELDSGGLPAVEVLRELISRFYDAGSQAPEAGSAVGTDNSAEFRRFVETLA